MHFTIGRIQKITEELKGYICPEYIKIEDFQFKEGNFPSVVAVEQDSAPWQNVSPGMRWGGRNKHGWFRGYITIPEGFAGKIIALQVSTGGEKCSWDVTNPQFMLYINQKLIQGLDLNHQEAILAEQAASGAKYQMDLHAYSGMADKPIDLFIRLVTVDKQLKEFYYNLLVPWQVAKQLPETDHRRMLILNVLNETVNRIDLRKPFSSSFYTSISKANHFLTGRLYQEMADYTGIVATGIGHTHIDLAWLWTLAQTREKAARSFATVLKLMEDYPEYIFMSSQPQLYQFVKQDYPEIYAKICARVKEGRWEPEGAMWVEADCNLSAGESLVRQLLFGTRFFRQEFGVENHILWLPDVFGYSAALPQILKKSGIDYFMTTKISWNEFNQIPYDTFMWEGIDGTSVLTYFITTKDPSHNRGPHYTTYNGEMVPEAIMGGWQRYQQKLLNQDILVAFGYGDGGGGPTPEMLENARRMAAGIPGCPKVQIGRVGEYFKRLAAKVSGSPNLPKWVGELYLEYHRGTYTSRGRNKRYNRLSELLYQDLELFTSWAFILGQKYPQPQINQGWETILLNQFHDILPGSSIKEVYEDSSRQYEQVIADGQVLLDQSLGVVAANVHIDKPGMIVFNTLSFARDEIAIVTLPGDCAGQHLVDDSGAGTKLQMIETDGIKQAIFLASQVPAKGYKTYYRATEPLVAPTELKVSKSELENRFFHITFDEKGTISSFYDKIRQRQLLPEGTRGNQLLAFEDKPMEFDNWEISLYYQEKCWELDTVAELTVVEQGPVRGGIRIRKLFLDSVVEQTIYIYQAIPRIDFDTRIDWQENQILLKAAFPVNVHAVKATYDIQFGNVERPTHWNTSWDLAKFEVSAHKWADLSEAGYGVSLLNDCKYGYDIKDGVMRLTLLKSGKDPNPEADRGMHQFCYSIYPHAGGWREGQTVQMAYSLNVPLYAKLEKAHSGSLPSQLSWFRIDRENVILETVKKAEDSGAIIVRLYECYNRRDPVRLSCYQQIKKVSECDLMEEEIAEIPSNGDYFKFEIKPYEIKTFKLEF